MLVFESEVAKSCPTLCDPMDCSLPGSSVHGIFPGKSTGVGCHCLLQKQLQTIHFCIHEDIFIHLASLPEKAMAPHSSTLAWKIPWTEEPGRLQFMESLRVGHDRATSLSLFTFMHGRRKWQPAPVFLPGESQGRGSLVGCCLWGRTASDTTDTT